MAQALLGREREATRGIRGRSWRPVGPCRQAFCHAIDISNLDDASEEESRDPEAAAAVCNIATPAP